MSKKTNKVKQSENKSENKTPKKADFHQKIGGKDHTFVLFYATWCPHSRQFLPTFQEFSKKNPEQCLSVIVDEEPDLCDEYEIEYYPTVIRFKNGKVDKRLDPEPGEDLDKKKFRDLTEKK